MQNRMIVVFLFALSLSVGCTSAGFKEYRAEKIALRERQAAQRSSIESIDSLWRAGFGFNNPNPERIKQGLAPQNFDGSIGKEKKLGYFDQLIHDAANYSLNKAASWPIQKITDLAIKRDLKKIADGQARVESE